MNVAVLGAGAWGTAIACTLASRQPVVLHVRDRQQAEAMRSARVNQRYLPEVELPAALEVESDCARAVDFARRGLIVIATPTRALRPLCLQLRALAAAAPVVWLCKGFEETEHLLAHEVVAAVWPEAVGRSGPLSGPSFALEVARGLPTALTVAGPAGLCATVTEVMHAGALRIYSSSDIVGVEVGGTVKNVLAIATGICDALELGLNARAALITRGLAEMTRLGVALGAQPATFMGLTGVGDLILTATGDLSRNRQVGLALGHGSTLNAAVDQLGHVAEGVRSAPAVLARARKLGVQMPITEAVCAVLAGEATPAAALDRLLARDPRAEVELPPSRGATVEPAPRSGEQTR
jgi:glycerol-3-phosphate dehydrogenase (NAD(P)+)